MALFGFGKKKEVANENTSCCCGGVQKVKVPACACNGNAAEYVASEDCCCGGGDCGIKSIKVLGPGCRSCHELNEACITAVKELGMELEVEYITDMEKIVSYGVMSMPALVINEKVVSMGKALKPAEIIRLLGKLGYAHGTDL